MTQDPTLHDLQNRIETLEETVNQLAEAVSSGGEPQGLSRRELLALAGSGAVAIAVGSAGTTKLLVDEATAQQVAQGEIGTNSTPLGAIHVEEWYANQENLELTQLTVDDLQAGSGGVVSLGGDGLGTVGSLNGADISSQAAADDTLETDGQGGFRKIAAVSDGDGTKREVWVIPNGANDPSGADPEDLILEEES